MKITWDDQKSDAYTAVGNIIEEWAKTNYYGEFIVHLRTSNLGESNELFLFEKPGKYIWESDWYEGGEVELLGFIPVDYVKVPPLREKDGVIITNFSDFVENKQSNPPTP